MSLEVALRHHFLGTTIDIAFTATTPGVTMLFGPSGSGKSTVIAACAGLSRPEYCRISIDGQVLGDTASGQWVPPERRRIGLVFQDARLFPHMSVATNLRYGLRRAPRQAEKPIKFDDIVDLLGIAPLLDRRPHTLSGGERQRVAIGRALLSQPAILLMDEPLAALDSARKAEILPFLARLKTALSLPILYVTHAMDEVARLADTLVLLDHGRVAAAGPIAEIAARADLPLALRDDAGAVIETRIASHDPQRRLTTLTGLDAPILIPLIDAPTGTSLRIRIPAREVILARERPAALSVQNIIAGTVRAITADAPRHAALVEVTSGAQAILARLTPDAVERLDLVVGRGVFVLFKSVGVEVLAD